LKAIYDLFINFFAWNNFIIPFFSLGDTSFFVRGLSFYLTFEILKFILQSIIISFGLPKKQVDEKKN
jgi:hypothetical protein